MPKPTLRAFECRFLVAIDESELDEPRSKPVSLEELKDYLHAAVVPQWNDEQHGNPCSVQSLEILFGSLKELPAAEVQKLYSK